MIEKPKSKKLIAIEAELDAIKKRSARRRKQQEADNQRRNELAPMHEREIVIGFIGQTDAIKFYNWEQRKWWKGTVTKVNRTRCHCDFGENGKWTVPIVDVRPADTEMIAVHFN